MGWNVPRQLQCHFCLCMVQYSPSSHSNLQDHGSRPFPWSSRFREIRSNASCFGTRSLCNRWHSTDDTFLILGLVRAPIMTTLIQVFSRIFIVWGIVPLFPDSVQDSYAYPIMLLAWSVTEVIRYSFYAWNILDEVPYFLLWLRYQHLGISIDCRYSTFWVLYPIGVGAELWTMTRALKDAYAWQPVYAAVIVGVMLGYIPGKAFALSFWLRLLFSFYSHDSSKEEGIGNSRWEEKLISRQK